MAKNNRKIEHPEHAVRMAPENTARALTPAETQARKSLMAIAFAEAKAKSEAEERKNGG